LGLCGAARLREAKGEEMAKITANGATEAARIRTTSHEGRVTYLWVMNSKGTILWRQTAASGYATGYTVYSRRNKPATRATLVSVAERIGHTVTG